MAGRETGGRAATYSDRSWLARVLRPFADGPRSRHRRESDCRPLAVETLEVRATVSDAFLSLLWSSAAAAFMADPLAGPDRRESTPIHRQNTGAGPADTLEQLGPVVRWPADRSEPPGGPATPVLTGSSLPVAVAAPFDLFGTLELASALAGLRGPVHPPVASPPPAGATPIGGTLSAEGAAGGSASGPGIVAAGASPVTLAPVAAAAPATPPGNDPPPPPPSGQGFKVSWVAGETDDSGNLTGGTELMNLAAHDGKLYAGTSVWKDAPGNDPVVGAQVLRLDSPKGRWQVDLNLSELMPGGTPRYLRISALTSVTFTTDLHGQRLSPPVSMLLAAPADNAGTLSVFGRDDATGTWTEMDVFPAGIPAGFRSFGFHQDTVTHVDHVFAGTGIFGIFAGDYDPTAPGRIRWNALPQLAGQNRPMAFAEINNVLYVAIDPGIYAHVDGLLAHWQMVYQFTDPPYQTDGLRGLTAVPNPSGDGQVLLASLEGYLGYVGYLDPNAGFTGTEELHFLPYFLQRWGGLAQSYVVAAYNDTTPLQDPKTGEPLELIGLQAQNPQSGHQNSSWYLVRHLDGSYDLHEIPPVPSPENPDPFLFATRAIAVSPFPEDQGKMIYFGGYDVTFDTSDHNTAWIYRAPRSVVLRS